MALFPYMPLYVESWVAATCHLSIAQRGAYMDLLVLMWMTPGCRVPNDNGWLQQHLRCSKDDLRELVRPVIEEFCRTDGNFIYQKRQQKVLIDAVQTAARLSALGKRRKTNNKDASST